MALDCTDPQALAQFYAALTGFELDYDGGDWVQLRSDTGATLAFQHAPDHQPPGWPSTDRPQQAHIDFDVADLDHAEEEVLVIVGLADTAPIRARRLARNQFQTRWSLN